jgi:hypothetical protein
MNIYLKIFLSSSIPFGGAMALFYHSMAHGILAGLMFGAIMTLIIGYMHTRKIREMGYVGTEQSSNVEQARNLVLNLPYDIVYALCLRSIVTIKKGWVNRRTLIWV